MKTGNCMDSHFRDDSRQLSAENAM